MPSALKAAVSSSLPILSGGRLQVGKAQKDLLQRDLAHRVIVHSILLLGFFQDTKYLFETEKLHVRESRTQIVSPLMMGVGPYPTIPQCCPRAPGEVTRKTLAVQG